MTDPTSQAAPGWYPVAAGSTQLRWWDGTQWTDNIHETARDGVGYQPAVPPKAPEGTNPNTVFGWLIPLTPLLSLVSLPIYFASLGNALGSFATDVRNDPTGLHSSLAFTTAVYSPTYFAVLFLSLVGYALAVVFGYLDWKALNARGVPRPFHWAWSFLEAPYVYVIGRSVVVRRRTGGGLGPLWLLIAVFVVGMIISLVGIVAVFVPLLNSVSTFR